MGESGGGVVSASHLFASFNTIPFLGGLQSDSKLSSVSGDSTLTVQFALTALSGLSTGDKIGLLARDVDGEGETDEGTRGGGGECIFFMFSSSFSDNGNSLKGHGAATGHASLLSSFSLCSREELLRLTCFALFPDRSSLTCMSSCGNMLTTGNAPANPMGDVTFKDEFKDGGLLEDGEGAPDEVCPTDRDPSARSVPGDIGSGVVASLLCRVARFFFLIAIPRNLFLSCSSHFMCLKAKARLDKSSSSCSLFSPS